ncbi:nucleoside 2-deoxyribosyltransferase [Bacillus sp. DJP31]|uniref:nucleoside 2-deoxyribosyltransferase n=1 Tax=Bacillus sp. DJP31 TaxID=3409789 RepID=UPI003BB6F263
MRFYIASGFENKELVRKVSTTLVKKGFTHTYDWTRNDRADSFQKLHSIGEAEKEGVKTADILVALLPGGKGTHIEIGMAIGYYKSVYIYCADPIEEPSLSCTFYHIDGVRLIHGPISELIEVIFRDFQEVIR